MRVDVRNVRESVRHRFLLVAFVPTLCQFVPSPRAAWRLVSGEAEVTPQRPSRVEGTTGV